MLYTVTYPEIIHLILKAEHAVAMKEVKSPMDYINAHVMDADLRTAVAEIYKQASQEFI